MILPLLLCTEIPQSISEPLEIEEWGSAQVYLPQLPADTTVSGPLTLEFNITGPGMDSMNYSWDLVAAGGSPVIIENIPSGSTRMFSGKLYNENGELTHKGEISSSVPAGDTVVVNLRLNRISGSAVICIEIEGFPWSSCDPQSNPEDGLVAYFPFNGNAKDESGTGNNGIVYGATLTRDRKGNPSSAYHFDGDDYIEVPYDTTLDCENAVTLSLWSKSDLTSDVYRDDGMMAQIGRGSEYSYDILFQYETRQMLARFRNHWTTTKNLDGGLHSPIPFDTSWHFYAITFDGDSLLFYVDNDWVGSIVAFPGEISNTPFRIGAESKSLSGFFHGTIDEVRVYNRALSAEEIMALLAD